VIFQDPQTSLNPVMTVGSQVVEVLSWHGLRRGRAAACRTLELLEQVGLPEPGGSR
jgi:ABC-type microcin C transport system duplicated ATPase subunit YejF